jgi:hypothetical protein
MQHLGRPTIKWQDHKQKGFQLIQPSVLKDQAIDSWMDFADAIMSLCMPLSTLLSDTAWICELPQTFGSLTLSREDLLYPEM